ncbi:MAG: hypothetical protein QXE31_05320 [Candidatus Woesearchaeota archaeon]
MKKVEYNINYKKEKKINKQFTKKEKKNNSNKEILIINTCSNKLSEYEFLEPIVNVIKNLNLNYFVLDYRDDSLNIILKNEFYLKKITHIIISGNPLKDQDFLKYMHNFHWIMSINKPLLGICAGMQIISLIFNSNLKKEKIISFSEIKTIKENPLFNGVFKAYEIHSNNVIISKDLRVIAKSKNRIVGIKHKEKPIYGVLFHPEVRNHIIIENFLKSL